MEKVRVIPGNMIGWFNLKNQWSWPAHFRFDRIKRHSKHKLKELPVNRPLSSAGAEYGSILGMTWNTKPTICSKVGTSMVIYGGIYKFVSKLGPKKFDVSLVSHSFPSQMAMDRRSSPCSDTPNYHTFGSISQKYLISPVMVRLCGIYHLKIDSPWWVSPLGNSSKARQKTSACRRLSKRFSTSRVAATTCARIRIWRTLGLGYHWSQGYTANTICNIYIVCVYVCTYVYSYIHV